MTAKERIEWIDYIKGVGIILVVFAHLKPAMPIEKYIYSFHMFLFFFISGWLLHPNAKKTRPYIRKKTISLLIPYCIYGILSALFDIIQGGNITKNIQAFFMINGEISWNTPIWFLWILFSVEIIYICAYKTIPGNILNYMLPIICLILSFLLKEYTLPFRLGIIPIGMFFFWLGNYIQRVSINEYIDKHLFVLFVLLILSIVISNLNGRISIVHNNYSNFWICIPCGIIGVISFSALIRVVSVKIKAPILLKIGRNSLFIMCAQYPVFKFLSLISQKTLKMDVWRDRGTIKAIVVTIISITIMYIVILFLNRVVPEKLKRYIGIYT